MDCNCHPNSGTWPNCFVGVKPEGDLLLLDKTSLQSQRSSQERAAQISDHDFGRFAESSN